MSSSLFVVYAAGIFFPDFCCLLSLLNAKRGQLNSYFWWSGRKFSKENKDLFFFFVELKVNNICIDLCLFKNLFAGRFAFFID